MIDAGFSYNGKLEKWGRNVKIFSKYHQEKVLRAIFTEEFLFLCPNGFDRVKLHQDQATSHTSESTAVFPEKMNTDTSIKHMSLQHIPTKSPDVSPMDYCNFGLLKRVLLNANPLRLID